MKPTAYQLGQSAYEYGYQRIPSTDKLLMESLKEKEDGKEHELEQWLRGYDFASNEECMI